MKTISMSEIIKMYHGHICSLWRGVLSDAVINEIPLNRQTMRKIVKTYWAHCHRNGFKPSRWKPYEVMAWVLTDKNSLATPFHRSIYYTTAWNTGLSVKKLEAVVMQAIREYKPKA